MRVSPTCPLARMSAEQVTCAWAVLASPLQGRRERGFSVLQYNPAMPLKNIVTGQRVTKEKLQRAKELRREMTPAEKILWQEVRAKKLGVRFRRQQVIQGFIVDFYCHPVKITRGLRQGRSVSCFFWSTL